MRKLLLLTFVLLISVVSYAVKPYSTSIAIDRVKEDGNRVISTNQLQHICDYKANGYLKWINANLLFIQLTPDSSCYILKLQLVETYLNRIEPGLKAHFKLENGETVSIECVSFDYNIVSSTCVKSDISYVVTAEQLETLATNNVVKVRIENNGGVGKIDFEKNRVKEAIGVLYPLIQKQLKVKKTYMSDF